jgi:glyoxylase-like metal-dependent hydrolase (beta-lactamase superfamily II)
MHRRDLLIGAAAASALAGTGRAQAPATPQFHRMAVGSLPVTVVFDGQTPRDVARNFVPNVTPEQISAALGGNTTIQNPYNLTIVETRAGLVLFDTGFGQGAPAGLGQNRAAMQAAGIDPARIAMVVFTHFHPDHISGLIAADGSPGFPNAVVKVPEREWAFWTDEGELTRVAESRRPNFAMVKARFAPYAARLERFAPGAEVAPGVTALATPGHSPGHTSFRVADGGGQLVIIGDAVTTPGLFMANPEWYPVFDMDPTQAVASRKALLDRLATDRIPVVGYHFPFPATGRVERAGTGYRLVAG